MPTAQKMTDVSLYLFRPNFKNRPIQMIDDRLKDAASKQRPLFTGLKMPTI